MLKVRDFSDVEALYHAADCECSEPCRRFSAENEKTMTTHKRGERFMKDIISLDEEIDKGEVDGSITPQRANNLRAWIKTFEKMAREMRVKGLQEGTMETKVIRQEVRNGEIGTVDEDGLPTIMAFTAGDGTYHEMPAAQVAWAANQKLIDGFTQRHMAKRGGTYRGALEVCWKLNPEYKRIYTGRRT